MDRGNEIMGTDTVQSVLNTIIGSYDIFAYVMICVHVLFLVCMLVGLFIYSWSLEFFLGIIFVVTCVMLFFWVISCAVLSSVNLLSIPMADQYVWPNSFKKAVLSCTGPTSPQLCYIDKTELITHAKTIGDDKIGWYLSNDTDKYFSAFRIISTNRIDGAPYIFIKTSTGKILAIEPKMLLHITTTKAPETPPPDMTRLNMGFANSTLATTQRPQP